MINLLTMLVTFLATGDLTITSTAFTANAMIPAKYTCQGQSTSPALHIAGLPSGTRSVAIIVHDPDAPRAGGFTHWVVCNIDPAPDVDAGFKGGSEGLNGTGKPGYIGPCPPSGIHHYHFMVYALDLKLKLDKSPDKAQLEKAMEGHILAKGELVGLYQKS